MSGAPKRSHEEGGGHSSSAPKYSHEDTGTYPKVPSSSISTEYHHPAPFDMGQDARMARIPRTEPRDSDRRSPLQHSVYRLLPSTVPNDSHLDSHQGASESRMESRDSKESREARVESREPRVEAREFYSEAAKREYQSGKSEKDGRFESRGDESKELKYDRETYSDPKGDVKVEKDVYGGASSHSPWKDSREYLRGKRYSEPPGGNTDIWHMQRANSQGPVEVGKEGSATEERDYGDAHEAVGENKFDLKGEDRFKDKDRKRKDGKHRDWGDRDKERSDRRSSLQVGSGEVKESAREEREAERWERERKDLKEKERPKEREKDHIKRESLNGAEKEGANNEKELGDGSVRIQEPENQASEQKKQKESDSWKNVDREARDRRRERDGDTEGDRPEKRSRCYDKESDDGCADGEGATEREREAFNYGVQQRKRMLRPRGSPQVANREPRFRPRAQDNDGYV